MVHLKEIIDLEKKKTKQHIIFCENEPNNWYIIANQIWYSANNIAVQYTEPNKDLEVQYTEPNKD